MLYKRFNFIRLSLILLLALEASCSSQHQKHLKKNDIMCIIDTCLVAFKSHYIYPDVVAEMDKFVRKKVENGQYSEISNLIELTKQIKNDLRYVSNDRHIWIDVIENLPITDSDALKEEIINKKRRNNFGFVEFEILHGNIAYLRIDAFNDIEYAKETAIHAMGMLVNSEAIILDLRHNHGGHGNMVHFISSYFFAEKTQLNSLYFRESDSLVEAWTDPLVPGKKLLRQKVYIITSHNTASAAESFTYSMKHYKRATIVGEHTRGAAHWKETYKYPDLGIFFEIPVARPINPITKKGWEGKGVKPDIEISEKEAYDRAYKLALEKK